MLSGFLALQRSSRVLRVSLMSVVFGLVVLFAVIGGVTSAQATTLSTPYLAMTVQAGQTVNLDLTVTDTVAQRVDLSVQGLPAEWEASIMGGGRPIAAIMTDPENPSSIDLQVKIPHLAEEGVSTLTVVARSGGASVSLPITFTVSEVEGGTTELTAEYASLRGSSKATFTFSLNLQNSTPEERAYNLTSTGPENWTLSLMPSGVSQETPTVVVESQGKQGLNLKVTPAANAEIGVYDIVVTATGGGETVSIPLQVEVTGTYNLSLTTADGNLNAEVKKGKTSMVKCLVVNNGTGPVQGVKLSATAPANWQVTFEPSVVESLPANQQMEVTAVITPAENVIAGDYVVTMTAKADQASADSEVRVTVKTSTLWGVIGVLIAIAAIAILGFVFRRFGHR
ncbi:MAG: hypothetical protein JW990_18060 [Thermoleophilia bacterium]|nr:hypothetical protein [Thermoleophilia bacterium]